MGFLTRHTVPIETQLENLKSCGIELNAGVTVDDLIAQIAQTGDADEARTAIEARPYHRIIDILGYEKHYFAGNRAGNEPLEFTPVSNKLWYWDSECVDDPKVYADAVERLDFMSGRVLGLSDIRGDIDFEQESYAYVEFTHNGERVRWDFGIDSDWMSYPVFVNFDALLEESGSGLRLYGNFEDYGQYAMLAAFRDDQYERFRQLSKVKLERLETALAAWIEFDSKPTPSLEDIAAAIAEPLARLGFDRRGPDEFTWDINDDVVCYITLDGEERPGRVEVAPEIGVRHHSLTELVRELEDVEYGAHLPVSMRASMAELIRPHESFFQTVRVRRKYAQSIMTGQWVFSDIEELPRLSAGIVEAIRDRAMPFFTGHDRLATIVADLAAGRFDRPDGPGYEPAVGLFLLGRPDEALTYMEARLENPYGPHQHGSSKYRAFVQALVERMRQSGWTLPPERVARFEALIAPPEDRRAAAERLRIDPFVDALDELLEPRGFSRSGLDWRKDARHAILVLSLDPGHDLRIWLRFVVKVFRRIGPNDGRVDPIRGYDILIPLTKICPNPVIYKLRRAFEFDHDYANSAMFEIDDSLTAAERSEIDQLMEPEVALTMAWRVAALRDVVETCALPLFEKIETRVLTRLGLALKLFYYGFSLEKY